jgi:hypothetical protein
MNEVVTIKLPTIDECDFEFKYDWETDILPEEHLDSSTSAQIRAQMNAGDMSAWFRVEVICSWRTLKSSDFLGGCSYKSFTAFEKDECAEDMKKEAYSYLISTLKGLH